MICINLLACLQFRQAVIKVREWSLSSSHYLDFCGCHFMEGGGGAKNGREGEGGEFFS